MTDSKSKPARAPRIISLDGVGVSSAEGETAKQSVAESKGVKAKSPISKSKPAKRKPRTVEKTRIVREVPDEAAQRINADELSELDISESLTPPPPIAAKPRFKWSRLFWGALFGLISLGIGLWVDQLIRDLFARQDWLGWLAVGLTALLIVAALAIALRELWGLSRMAKIDGMRETASSAMLDDNMTRAKSLADDLIQLYAGRPDTARGRGLLEEHSLQIMDATDLIALIERDLMHPLDEKARGLVMGSAKRVSVVTAVSPRALVDVGYVLLENMRLIRRLAELYGGRPGTLGFWRLARNVIGHLAVTGSIAIGDGLVQQLVGHGLAAKISSRLGEGVVNGLLTARIGIAAIDICRPLPFTKETRPSIKDFMGELTRFSTKDSE